MATNSVNLYSLALKDSRTFIYSTLFVIGNVLLPQICHLIPDGGFIFLPIYFFTLIGAYKYGWKVGMLTAIASPLVNHFFFGMPPVAVLPSLLIKSTLLALAAAYVAKRYQSVNILLLIATVLFYQIVGSLIESCITGSLAIGFQDFSIGIPGMVLQVVGGYFFINILRSK